MTQTERRKPKVCLNGATAWREGAALKDNPYDKQRQPVDWQDWVNGYKRAENHFLGGQ